MKRLLTSIALVGAAAFSGCAVETDQPGTAADGVEAVDPGGNGGKGGGTKGPKLTVNQENAVRSANGYLDYSAFSKAGLIKQLKYEGYKQRDAQFAVNNIKVNWMQQAAKSAQDYLEYTSFSRDGLIQQLEYEGYTPQQAAHGATQAGLR